MDTILRQAIARIEIIADGAAGRPPRGTGFLVAPDLVLTAMHVVADRSAPGLKLIPGRIALTFPTHTTDATVVPDAFDARADWALLQCAAPPPSVRPIPLSDSAADGEKWESFGFPDANPRDGLAQVGEVRHAAGVFEGVAAYQLFCEEAQSGSGAPEAGASGSPVIIEGAVVALLRASLMKEGQNVAGTLYGCPMDAVFDRCGKLLPLPDPCRGLPGLPHQPLPAEPFRFLAPFSASDAEIFFGRDRAIRELYDLATSEDAPPLVLLYGQSGAGKSSLLDAGVMPRLAPPYVTRYVRRDRNKGLLGTLIDAVAGTTQPLSSGGLRQAWNDLESARGGPLLVVLDQVEEAFTQPSSDANEFNAFVDAVASIFENPGAPRGRLILGFRKEWLAEIKKHLDEQSIQWKGVFLKALESDSVVEIVNGLTRTKRLRTRYGLTIESRLAETMARDLTADRNSPVAPMLQVLLSRMWRAAKAASDSQPAFTNDLYEQLKTQGFLLTDFLDQQLAALAATLNSGAPATAADVLSSGLALDVLRFHVSDLGTACDRSRDVLLGEYARGGDVKWLVDELKNLYLLSEPAGETQAAGSSTRLAHDTLAAAVRARFDVSQLPGQRARRIVENRSAEWTGEAPGTTLDTRDLNLVEAGLAGMRTVRAHEQKLIDASRARAKEAAERAAFDAKCQQMITLSAQVPVLLDMNRAVGLAAAVVAVDRSIDVHNGELRPGVHQGLAIAVDRARERFVCPLPGEVTAIALDGNGAIAVGTAEGRIQWCAAGAAAVDLRGVSEPPGPVMSLAFSDDSKMLAAALGNRGVAVFREKAKPIDNVIPDGLMAISVWFAPGGHSLLVACGREDRLAFISVDLDGKTAATTTVFAEPFGQLLGPLDIAVAWSPDGAASIAIVEVIKDAPVPPAEPGTHPEPPTQVHVWNADGTRVAGPFKSLTTSHIGAVALAHTAKGDLLLAAASTSEYQLPVWNVTTGEAFEPISTGVLTHIAFTGGAQMIVGVRYDGTLATPYVGYERGDALVPLACSAVMTMAVSADGSRIALGDMASEGVRARVLDTDGILLHPPLRVGGPGLIDRGIAALAFVPGSGALVAGGRDASLTVWTPELSEQSSWLRGAVTRIDGGQSITARVAVDAKGETLACVGIDGMKLRKLSDPPGETLDIGTKGWDVVISPDGRVVFAIGSKGLTIWNVATRQQVAKVADDAWGVACDARGETFAVMRPDRVIEFVDGRGQKTSRGAITPTAGVGFSAMVFHSDGTLICGTNRGEVQWNPPDGSKPRIIRAFAGSAISGLALDPSGKTLFATAYDGLRAIDMRTGSLLNLRLAAEDEPCAAVAMSPDGRLLATLSHHGIVRLRRASWRDWLEIACHRLEPGGLFGTTDSDAALGIANITPADAYDVCKRQHPPVPSSDVYGSATVPRP